MEQERTPQQFQQAQHPPARCPRCNSMNTKFRYYNNHNVQQPRHLCRTCRRNWTVGGTFREVPVGGNSRNKPNKKHGSKARAQPAPPPFPPMVPQNRAVPRIGPTTNLPQPIAPPGSYHFTNMLYGAMDSQIQPGYMNVPGNVGAANMSFLQDWNIQPIAEPHGLPQLNPVNPVMADLNQPQVQIDPYQVSMHGTVQPDWQPAIMNNFNVSTSDAWGNSSVNTTNKPTKPDAWGNSSGHTTNIPTTPDAQGNSSGNTTNMPTTSADPCDWRNFLTDNESSTESE